MDILWPLQLVLVNKSEIDWWYRTNRNIWQDLQNRQDTICVGNPVDPVKKNNDTKIYANM